MKKPGPPATSYPASPRKGQESRRPKLRSILSAAVAVVLFAASWILGLIPLAEGRPLDGFTLAAVVLAILGALYVLLQIEIRERRR